jgi:hypothetical protein
MRKEYLVALENLNKENINLQNSPEYKYGKDFLAFKKMLKHFQIIKIFEKIINRKKIDKLNCYKDHENNYIYKDNSKYKNSKIVVYTCITGKYDKFIDPLLKFENIDYVAFTDNENIKSSVWQIKKIPIYILKINDNILINRYIKFHPKELFAGKYDYSIYIDGNIKVISDLTSFIYGINELTGLALHYHHLRNCLYNEATVCLLNNKGNKIKIKKLIKKYHRENFPSSFGLYECGVIVCNLNNNKAENILSKVYEELVCSETYRDQLVFPYIIWKNNYKFTDVNSLGNNIYKNYKIRIEKHE